MEGVLLKRISSLGLQWLAGPDKASRRADWETHGAAPIESTDLGGRDSIFCFTIPLAGNNKSPPALMEIKMPNKINKWFRPPLFPEDEDKTRKAGMLHFILLALLGSLIVAVLLALTQSGIITNRAFFIASFFIALGVIGALLALLHGGHVRLAAWAFTLFQWASTVTQIVGSGGMESPAIGAFVVTLMLAGFLISGRAVTFFALLSVLAILGVWRLENAGQLPPPLLFASPQAKVFFVTTLMAVSAVLLNLVMRALTNSLIRSRTYAKEQERVLREKTQAEADRESFIRELETKNAESEILRESAAAIALSLNLDETVSRILDQLRRVVPYDSASIHLLKGGELEVIGAGVFPKGKMPWACALS